MGRNTLISSIKKLNDSGHSIIISTHDPIIQNILSKDSEIVMKNGINIQITTNNSDCILPIKSSKFTRKESMLRWNFRLDLREMATPSARWVPGILAFGILLGSGLIDSNISNLGLGALALSPAMISALIRPAVIDRLNQREMGGVWSVAKQGSLSFDITIASISIVPVILAVIGIFVLLPTPNTIQGYILFLIIPTIMADISAISGLIHHRFGSGERPGLMVLLMIPFAWVLLTLCSALEATTLEAMKEAWTGVMIAFATNVGLFLLAWALHE